jgi:hypothetical protein
MANVYDYPFNATNLPLAANTPYPFYQDNVKKFNDISERPTDDHDSSEEDP